MWGRLGNARDFYATLPWMPRGRELWSALEIFGPIILTGVPYGEWAGSSLPRARATPALYTLHPAPYTLPQPYPIPHPLSLRAGAEAETRNPNPGL